MPPTDAPTRLHCATCRCTAPVGALVCAHPSPRPFIHPTTRQAICCACQARVSALRWPPPTRRVRGLRDALGERTAVRS